MATQKVPTVLVLAFALFPAVAFAQVATETSSAAFSRIDPDHEVLVRGTDGRTVRGSFDRITEQAVLLWVRPSKHFPDGRRSIPLEAVARIDERDPVASGAWLGLGAGLLGTYAFAATVCGGERECMGYAGLYGWLTIVPISIVTGALVDLAHTRTLYAPPRAKPSGWRASPILGPSAGGIALSKTR